MSYGIPNSGRYLAKLFFFLEKMFVELKRKKSIDLKKKEERIQNWVKKYRFAI